MTNYKLLDAKGNEIHHRDLQDKTAWCDDGASIELAFVRKYGEIINIRINPEKQTNPYAPDLEMIPSGAKADLKVQNTPFFKAQALYGIDPTFAVVFNEKDYTRYSLEYPDISIYYWVTWKALSFVQGSVIINVQPLEGVWGVWFPELKEYCDQQSLHEYQQRKYDNRGNAKSSYVLDIRNPIFHRLI